MAFLLSAGVGITYDKIGNPLSDGTWTYTWQNGRQLARMQSVDIDASFIYNENGLRVQKTVNEVVTKYTLHGKNIVHMTQGGNELHFFYDAQNKPVVVVYNDTPYSYVKNLQGDVVALLDNTAAVVVAYKYDAWGRPISKTGSLANTLGTVQPFRYRGYVYDEETGFYYLRSRYYLPVLGRFINPDSEIHTEAQVFGAQLFGYCANNPIKNTDTEGTWFWDAVKEAAAAIVVVAVVVAVVAVAVAVTAGTGGMGLAFAGGGMLANAAVAGAAWSVAGVAAKTAIGAGFTYLFADAARSTASQMQQQVESGKAPKQVDRVDKPHRGVPGSKDHVHYKDGTAMNYDGTPSHKKNGLPKLTKTLMEWLDSNGWMY